MSRACEYDKKDFEQLYGFVHYLYCIGDYYSAAFVAAGFSYNGKHRAFVDYTCYDDVYKGSAGVFGIPDGAAFVNGFQTFA